MAPSGLHARLCHAFLVVYIFCCLLSIMVNKDYQKAKTCHKNAFYRATSLHSYVERDTRTDIFVIRPSVHLSRTSIVLKRLNRS